MLFYIITKEQRKQIRSYSFFYLSNNDCRKEIPKETHTQIKKENNFIIKCSFPGKNIFFFITK